jgi:hypothetical protein
MKTCKPQYEHIDQAEFGDGRKITTSLLTRYCRNIQGLWKKTKELEDNTDPELRKRFTPPLIHTLHTYGVRLNADNEYEFDNSTETIFIDPIGLKTIEIENLKKTEFEEKTLYKTEFKTTHNIAKIAINKEENIYPSKNTLDELKKDNYGYYIEENTLYIKLEATATLTKVLVTLYTDDPYIDRKNTTAYIDLAKNRIHSPYSKKQIEEEVLDQNTAVQYTTGANGEEIAAIRGVEKYWNFGWRRFNHFWMYPIWLQDPFSENPNTPPIPTVARAFILTPRNTGLLTRIRLMFNVKEGAEDEAYLEIRTLTPNGYPSNKILTREKTRIRGTNQPLLHTIPLTTPPLLTKGEKYAVVLRAGFTSADKNYGLGGWSFTTYGPEFIGNLLHKAGTKIKKTTTSGTGHIYDFDEDIVSDIFHSIDNCVSWTKTHSISLAGMVEDAFDGMRPRAFSYQSFIQPLKETPTQQEGESYVYWKPIQCNPIQSVQLIPSMQGDGIKWEVSTNMIDWHHIKHPNWNYNFQKDAESHEKDQNQLYIRAQLKNTGKTTPPEINGLKVLIQTKPAEEAYLKTLFYNPRLGNLLGASLWSRLGTTVTLKPPLTNEIDVKIDIIRNQNMKDILECNGKNMTFTLTGKPSKNLIKVTILPSTLYLQKEEATETIETTTTELSTEDTQKIENLQKILENIDHMYETVKNNPENKTSVMQELAKHFTNTHGIIEELQCEKTSLEMLKGSLEPLKTLEGCDKSECLLNYIIILRNVIINTINLIKKPKSKYINIIPSIPGREGLNLELTENRDYTINYETGTITLKDAWGVGTLKVEYYPLWLQGLKLEEFPLRTDSLTETFTTKTFKLKTVPLDPLRIVEEHNPKKDEWNELTENKDYTVNYSKKTIEIHKNREDMEYRVKYTPYLVDEGLALAYRLKRHDISQQAIIKSCYFQNRV